jgi:hypothetical protein
MVRIAIGAALLWLLFERIPFHDVASSMGEAKPWPLAAALLVSLIAPVTQPRSTGGESRRVWGTLHATRDGFDDPA